MIENMLSTVVGRPEWKRNKGVTKLSEFVTPSDEAFMFVAVRNSMKRWEVKHLNSVSYDGISDRPLPPPIYTRGPTGMTTKKYLGKGGWNLQGMMDFVKYHTATVEHCKTTNYINFETRFLAKQSKNGTGTFAPGMTMPVMPMDLD